MNGGNPVSYTHLNLDGHMYTEIVEGPLHDVTYDDPEE